MTTTQKMLRTSKARATFLAVMLSLGLSASPALAVERDGMALFFSFEELRESLHSPARTFRDSLEALFQLQPEKSELARRVGGNWQQHGYRNSDTTPVLSPSRGGN